jgi:enamine deaminase RidA (YjgF/YER057c/UK114 family)
MFADAVGDVEVRLREMGIELPNTPPIGGTYVNAVRAGDLIYTAGHVPFRPDGSPVLGKLGEQLDIPAGREAARLAGLGVLATLRHELGSLERVERFVRVLCTVNATPDFLNHTQVANGASDLFVEVFGDRGKHARLAVGVSSLPFNIALEVEAIVQVQE